MTRPCREVNTACATSNYAFINAAMHIRAGQADVILAGGTEAACTPMGLGGFIACRALRQDLGTRASGSRSTHTCECAPVHVRACAHVHLTLGHPYRPPEFE